MEFWLAIVFFGLYLSLIGSWTNTNKHPVASDKAASTALTRQHYNPSTRTSHWSKAYFLWTNSISPILTLKVHHSHLLAMQWISTQLLTLNGHKTTTYPLCTYSDLQFSNSYTHLPVLHLSFRKTTVYLSTRQLICKHQRNNLQMLLVN